MPRTARSTVGGIVYHTLNRGNNRQAIFRKDADYNAFLQLMIDARQQAEVEIFGFCLMPNHWHIVLRPRGNQDLAAYLGWLSNTHVKRYRAHYPSTSGHLYQGRYRSFPVAEDMGFLMLMRYVESNPLRCHRPLVARAQDWPWSSLGCGSQIAAELLSAWPVERPARWTTIVNRQQDDAERQRITLSIERDRPLGPPDWVHRTAAQLGLTSTLNPRGRPRNPSPAKAASR
jgi:putative transposase